MPCNLHICLGIRYNKGLFLVGSTCSMLNDNDYMASTTTLQSHVPPIIEILDTDENLQDDMVERETISVTG